MSAHLPITPAQIADEAIAAAEAGAAIVHLHARDPQRRAAVARSPALFMEFLPAIKARLRRGHQHHDRRRPEHDRAGAARVRASPASRRCAR